MFIRRTRGFVVFALIFAIALSTSPSFARGGRGGRGGGGGGGRPAGGGRPSSGLNANNLSKNLGGQVGKSPRGLAGGQPLQGALQQAGQGGLQQALNGRAEGMQNLQSKFQQQAGQFQQRAGERSGQAQQTAQDRASQFQSQSEPFSPAWYADHPQAWQYTHPHADAAAVATAAGVAAWVGAAYSEPYDSTGGTTTVVYQEVPAEETTTETLTPEQAPAVVANVAADAGEWMPLGTYSLATTTNAPPTLLLQLAVDRSGQLKGVYYDSLTNTTHNLTGTLDQATQNALWSLETNQQLTFQAPLNELLKPTGTVEVKLATGPQQWQLVRVEQK